MSPFSWRKKVLRAALIGLGEQGKKEYFPILKASSRIELVGVCDPNTARLEDLSGEFRKYESADDLFSSEELDFIVVAIPHDAYPKVILEAAERGVHVLKEKPFARNLAEGIFFQTLAEKHGILLRSYPQRRFSPVLKKLPEFLSKIGEPFFLDIRYTLFVENPHEGWRGSRKIAGGGCILDMGYHMIDALVSHFGLPSQVHAHFSAKAIAGIDYDAEDTASIHFSYPSGLYGTLLLSRYLPPKQEIFSVIGTQGVIRMEKNKIYRGNSRGDMCEEYAVGESSSQLFLSAIHHFCNLIQGDVSDGEVYFEHQQQALKFIEACYASKNLKTAIDMQSYIPEEVGLCLS